MNMEDNFFPTIVSHFTTNFNMVVVYPGSSTNFAVWQAHIPKNLGALLKLLHHVYLIMFLSTIMLTRALLCEACMSFFQAVQVTLLQRSLRVPSSSCCSLGLSCNALETQGDE
jgi:hypothetical protein